MSRIIFQLYRSWQSLMLKQRVSLMSSGSCDFDLRSLPCTVLCIKTIFLLCWHMTRLGIKMQSRLCLQKQIKKIKALSNLNCAILNSNKLIDMSSQHTGVVWVSVAILFWQITTANQKWPWKLIAIGEEERGVAYWQGFLTQSSTCSLVN